MHHESYEDTTTQLTREEIITILQQYQLFTKLLGLKGQVHFTCGEPLLSEHLPEYIQFASKELDLTTKIFTNSTLLTELGVYQLAWAGLRVVQVSLDGMQSTHDQIRGKGAFSKATKALQWCIETGLKTTVMMTVNKNNLGDVSRLVAHCVKLGVRRFGCARMIPIGQGNENPELNLSVADTKKLFKTFKKVRSKFQKKILFAVLDPLWLTCQGTKKPLVVVLGSLV